MSKNIKIFITVLIILVFVGGLLLSGLTSNPTVNNQITINNQNNDQSQTSNQNKNSTTSMDQNSKLQIKDIVIGNGVEAKSGDILTMNYTGTLDDGTAFDSNVDPKFGHVQPFSFTLGAGRVIQGWDQGILGMKVGGKRELTIPSEMGYGSSGQGPIPPNATLHFTVELVSIAPN